MVAHAHVGEQLGGRVPRQQRLEGRVHRAERHVQPARVRVGVVVLVGLAEHRDDLPLLGRGRGVAHAQRGEVDHRLVLAREQPQQQHVQRGGEVGVEQEGLGHVYLVQVVARRAQVGEPALVAALEVELGGKELHAPVAAGEELVGGGRVAPRLGLRDALGAAASGDEHREPAVLALEQQRVRHALEQRHGGVRAAVGDEEALVLLAVQPHAPARSARGR